MPVSPSFWFSLLHTCILSLSSLRASHFAGGGQKLRESAKSLSSRLAVRRSSFSGEKLIDQKSCDDPVPCLRSPALWWPLPEARAVQVSRPSSFSEHPRPELPVPHLRWQGETLLHDDNNTEKICEQVVTSVQTVLTCSKLISPQAMSQVIRFLYTGRIDSQIINIGALKQVTTTSFIQPGY